jgi:hypothetical protein
VADSDKKDSQSATPLSTGSPARASGLPSPPRVAGLPHGFETERLSSALRAASAVRGASILRAASAIRASSGVRAASAIRASSASRLMSATGRAPSPPHSNSPARTSSPHGQAPSPPRAASPGLQSLARSMVLPEFRAAFVASPARALEKAGILGPAHGQIEVLSKLSAEELEIVFSVIARLRAAAPDRPLSL